MARDMQQYIQELRQRKETATGTPVEVETQHNKSRLTAQERIHILFDAGTF